MPLMNSMGAFKQQHVVVNVGPTPTPASFYTAFNFNSATDTTNRFSVAYLGGYPHAYGYAKGTSNYSFVYKMNPNTGALMSSVVYSGNEIRGVVTDSSGNYHLLMEEGTNVFSLIKLNSSFGYITSKQFTGMNTSGDDFKISIDGSDNIYFSNTALGLTDIIKIDSSYNLVFASRITGSAGTYNKAGIDSSGNIYSVYNNVDNLYIQKIGSGGATIAWQKTFYDAGITTSERAFNAYTDSSGNTYVAAGTDDASYRVLVSKFDTNGSVIFNKTITLTSVIGSIFVNNIMQNSDGNILIQGYFGGTLFFIELNTSGTIVNQSYISGADLSTSIAGTGNGAAGSTRVYIPYTTENTYQMFTLLSLPNSGYFGSTPANVNYTYKSVNFSGTLTDNTASYTIATNSTAWTTTSYTLASLSITTGTPTLTTVSVSPFDHYQSI